MNVEAPSFLNEPDGRDDPNLRKPIVFDWYSPPLQTSPREVTLGDVLDIHGSASPNSRAVRVP